MLRVLIFLISLGARTIRAMCRRRADLMLENLVLQQQVAELDRGQRSVTRTAPPTNDPTHQILAA